MDGAEIGSRIAERRADLNLSQVELARQIGLSQSALSRIESGDRRVTSTELRAIARCLSISADELLVTGTVDLGEGLRYALRESAVDEIPDIIRFADVPAGWSPVTPGLEKMLEEGTYRAATPERIELPKDLFMIRPLDRLSIVDRVVYQALVGAIGPAIDAALSDCVYSVRYSQSKSGILFPPRPGDRKPWIRFQEEGKRLYESYDYAYMLSTDIVSFFEYIDLDILARDLGEIPAINAKIRTLLLSFLRDLQRSPFSSSIVGLPQGPMASRILANLYLLPLDQYLARQPEVTFIRFLDDIRVFSNDRFSLRRILQDITRRLRYRRLNVAVSKTHIFEGSEILEQFEDDQKNAIAYGLAIQNSATPSVLREFFDTCTAEREPRARDLRFAIYRLGELEDDHAVAWITRNLSLVPYLGSLIVGYLTGFIDDEPLIERRVRSYLESEENIFPAFEAHLLRLLGRKQALSPATLAVLWEVIEDHNRPQFVQEHALRAMGRQASPGEFSGIRSIFHSTVHESIKRACAVALYEGDQFDQPIAQALRHGTWLLRATGTYLGSKPVLPEP